MDLVIILVAIALFVILPILAVRYGADSRKLEPRHPNWP